MMRTSFARVAAVVWLIVLTSRAATFEREEHRQLADSAFAAVIAELDLTKPDSLIFLLSPDAVVRLEKNMWQGKSFGEICAQFSGDDVSRSRFHWRGKTILQQLRSLSGAFIEKTWRERGAAPTAGAATRTWPKAQSVEQFDQNVVGNYFLHHYLALRFAQLAGAAQNQGKEALRRALIYEAMAQSYLADAFSAGHLLAPSSGALSSLNRINNQRAHDFFSREGAFVINSRGDVWRTFGDKLLHWFAPTYRAVFDASVASLREIFLVYYASANAKTMPVRLKTWGQTVAAETSIQAILSGIAAAQDGEKYYATIKLPALQLLPMPVSASWSVRTDSVDERGVHQRKHYPQLRESGYHDPDSEGLDKEFLYPKSAVISTMILPILLGQNAADVIKSNPDVASVRYVQKKNFPPSYVGLLFSLEGGTRLNAPGKNLAAAFGMGYGVVDDFIVLKKVGALVTVSRYDSRRLLLSPTMGFGIRAGLIGGLIDAIRFEGGYAWGLRAPHKARGFKTAVGLEFPTIPLGFTYSGVTIRLKYQSIAVERKLRGVFLELVLH